MTLKTLTGIIAFLTLITGTVLAIEARYAHAAELNRVENTLQGKILTDELYQTRERIWALEDRMKEHPNDQGLVEDKRHLELDEERLRRELDKLK